MTDEQAAKFATNIICKRVDPNSLGIEKDDLLQEARMGIWRQADIIAKLDHSASRDRAMVSAGKLAIIDYLRETHGRSPAMHAKRKAIRVQANDDDEASDHWTADPQRLVEAMEMWQATAKIPTKLQILATLFGVGYSGVEIADFMGVSEGRVSQLKTDLAKILGAMT